MTDNLEEPAKRIAEQGREALLAGLRPAFQETLSAHADLLALDRDQVEQMVQRAVDHADGVQWRRALASVATRQLGIGLGEALSHPVVARAQQIAGAPSYEEGLAKLGLEVPAPSPAKGAREVSSPQGTHADGEQAGPVAAPMPDPVRAVDDPGSPLAGVGAVVEGHSGESEDDMGEPEHPPGDPEGDIGEPEPGPATEVRAVVEDLPDQETALSHDAEGDEFYDEEPEPLRLAATHVGGIATLQAGEEGLELRFGQPGLDIARKPGRVLGRLRWGEINALDVTPGRGLRRRRRQDRAQLVIRTEHGDATFEIPGVTEDELREHVEPLLMRYGAR